MSRQKCPLSLMELLTGGLAYHTGQDSGRKEKSMHTMARIRIIKNYCWILSKWNKKITVCRAGH